VLWLDGRWRLAAAAPLIATVPLMLHAAYAFAGRWEGWEAGVTAFNLLNHDHYESLPSMNGQPASEIMRSRWTGTVSYKF